MTNTQTVQAVKPFDLRWQGTLTEENAEHVADLVKRLIGLSEWSYQLCPREGSPQKIVPAQRTIQCIAWTSENRHLLTIYGGDDGSWHFEARKDNAGGLPFFCFEGDRLVINANNSNGVEGTYTLIIIPRLVSLD